MNITITGITLDGHLVPVPVGLSDLLKDTWVIRENKSSVLEQYDRRVEKRGEHFVTVLTLKKSS